MKQIITALTEFMKVVPSLSTLSTARIQTNNGKGFEFEFAELGYICSVINPVLAANGLHIYHFDELIDGQEVLASTIYHISGESLPTSRKIIPKGINKNTLYEYGSAKTYFRRYVTLGMLNLWHGVDDAGFEYEPRNENFNKSTTATYGQQKGLPAALDDQTKENYLFMLSSLYTSDKKEFDSLDEAMRNEFKFDGKLSDNIQEPKHTAFIENWINAYNNK